VDALEGGFVGLGHLRDRTPWRSAAHLLDLAAVGEAHKAVD
jgi:hypothetical protein